MGATMGEPTDPKTLVTALNRALPLLARDAMASAMAAGAMPGVDGVALAPHLAEVAAAETADVQRLTARVASLGGTPSVRVTKLEPPEGVAPTLRWLAAMQQEATDAIVAAIPADADDTEGEATEHLLEHIAARKRDVVELLERALR